ncbi:MAG: diguanylate cyclase domain-containing protein, partial [Solirubrobacteraceae bacterium]
ASGGVLDQRFARLVTVWTLAVGRWMAGEGEQTTREAGRECLSIFAELALRRAAPLEEMTKLCLRWRDATADVARGSAVRLRLAPEALSEALLMLQRSLDATLVRMCGAFDAERRQADEELTFMATHDALTGLPNRVLIAQCMQQMLARSSRQRASVSVLFIDLDDFKVVNDTLGHSAGDELLRAVTARLRGVVRDSDALGRLGGDEFVVLVDELSADAGHELVARRLLETFAEPFLLAGGTVRMNVTASVGVASGVYTSSEELLREADIAMYRAKRDGKNRYAVFPLRAGAQLPRPNAAAARKSTSLGIERFTS